MFDPKLKEALGRVQKPGRYTGGEPGSIYKEKDKVDVRFAFCFPDTYEVGMSFLGEKILYELLNSHENWWCERAFMPWLDMKAEMERLQLPLYTMESKDPLTAFDAVGFTLQYELSYTNILAMLDLAGIPFYSKDRDDRWPLIVAGGPCACNSEPIADFFDVIQLGEGENQLPAICAEIEKAKKEGISKKQLLLNIAKIPGVYIPAFYDVTYHDAVFGLWLDDWMDAHLYNGYVVAATLIIYGVLFIILENHNQYTDFPIQRTSQISYQTALFIGLFQVLSLVPGTSRSGSTILGAMILGCSRSAAAEFSFFLGIPVMFGASLLKLVKFGFHFTGLELFYLIAGMVIAFVVSVYSIKFLMGYIRKNNFKVFGYYRIVLCVIVLFYFGVTAFL